MDDFVVFCTEARLRAAGRIRGEVAGRAIVVFLVRSTQLYCIDARCYHTGGPLDQGDIEELGSLVTVVCPWHRYIIDLADGHSYYYDLSRQRKDKGARQRIHQVKIEDGNVLVRLSKLPGGEELLPSDHYCPATDEEKRRMGLLP